MGLLQVLRIQPSVEFELMLPYDSDSYDTLEIITNKFGGPGNGALHVRHLRTTLSINTAKSRIIQPYSWWARALPFTFINGNA